MSLELSANSKRFLFFVGVFPCSVFLFLPFRPHQPRSLLSPSHPPRPPQALRVPLWILAEGNFGWSKPLRFPLTLSWFSARAQEGVRCGICFLGPWKRTPCSALGVFKEHFKQRTRWLTGGRVTGGISNLQRIKESFYPFNGGTWPAFIKPLLNDNT